MRNVVKDFAKVGGFETAGGLLGGAVGAGGLLLAFKLGAAALLGTGLATIGSIVITPMLILAVAAPIFFFLAPKDSLKGTIGGIVGLSFFNSVLSPYLAVFSGALGNFAPVGAAMIGGKIGGWLGRKIDRHFAKPQPA